MTALATPAARSRRGGLTPTVFVLEFRRLLRNRRTVVFTLIMPVVFLLLFGSNADARTEHIGEGNVTGYIVLSLALYGAILATTSAGAAVSVERASGWSRHLRLTPLRPAAYVGLKLALALALGLISILIAFAAGRLEGADLPVSVWLLSGVLAWGCAVVFAAFGLFMGYLLPSENVMQVLGPVLAIMSFAGGLFVPLDQLGHTFSTIAHFTPTYGVGVIVRYPLTHEGTLPLGMLNVAVWTSLFVAGTVWRFRRDTARV